MKNVTFLCLLFAATQAYATANNVPPGYTEVANTYRVPAQILYAIALQESQHRLGNTIARPWPWTINIGGKGYRFESRAQAYAAIQDQLARGVDLIDIGLMQINWRYHKSKLRNTWIALDPYFNLHIAAQILRSRFEETNNWWTAVGEYHSPGKGAAQIKRARTYIQSVSKKYTSLNPGTPR